MPWIYNSTPWNLTYWHRNFISSVSKNWGVCCSIAGDRKQAHCVSFYTGCLFTYSKNYNQAGRRDVVFTAEKSKVFLMPYKENAAWRDLSSFQTLHYITMFMFRWVGTNEECKFLITDPSDALTSKTLWWKSNNQHFSKAPNYFFIKPHHIEI